MNPSTFWDCVGIFVLIFVGVVAFIACIVNTGYDHSKCCDDRDDQPFPPRPTRPAPPVPKMRHRCRFRMKYRKSNGLIYACKCGLHYAIRDNEGGPIPPPPAPPPARIVRDDLW